MVEDIFIWVLVVSMTALATVIVVAGLAIINILIRTLKK